MKKNAITSLFSKLNPDDDPWYVMLAWAGGGILMAAMGLGLILMIVRVWKSALCVC